ncbi:unnamed protein product [Protopolystoma xenopodis]|uniref:Uncharacterized protein n=1 Tax=Protopolystoma xenopodis TaxID=117903 RepID=A0A448X5G3_9PLAT|nr:unnamed protein product [Protopolystoma xenopodis]
MREAMQNLVETVVTSEDCLDDLHIAGRMAAAVCELCHALFAIRLAPVFTDEGYMNSE